MYFFFISNSNSSDPYIWKKHSQCFNYAHLISYVYSYILGYIHILRTVTERSLNFPNTNLPGSSGSEQQHNNKNNIKFSLCPIIEGE